jgi:protease II
MCSSHLVVVPSASSCSLQGAYEVSNDVYFSSSRLALLDRGFVFGVAHVRGGGDLGRLW